MNVLNGQQNSEVLNCNMTRGKKKKYHNGLKEFKICTFNGCECECKIDFLVNALNSICWILTTLIKHYIVLNHVSGYWLIDPNSCFWHLQSVLHSMKSHDFNADFQGNDFFIELLELKQMGDQIQGILFFGIAFHKQWYHLYTCSWAGR